MAPEQARGESADFFSDLFTVGIIGYLLLTGRHPFADPNGLFQIPELLQDPNFGPEPPRALSHLSVSQQRLYREYAAVVMRLLNREKAGRFVSAVEAIDAIEAVTPSLDCPACSERVPEQSRFCLYCGSELQLTPAPAISAFIETDTVTPEQLVDEGFALTRIHRWDAAIARYEAAIEKDSKLQKAYRNLGFALNHVRQYEQAVEVLTRGLSLPVAQANHLAGLLYERSYAYFNLTKYDDAYNDIQTALQHQRDSPRFLYYRARIQRFREHLNEARADAVAVLETVPDHVGALRLIEELNSLTG
jgi:tetratricopeptide (TPR) repeat protein